MFFQVSYLSKLPGQKRLIKISAFFFYLPFQHFDNVTVMFSYLDGFVTICSQVSAMEIVNLVNTMFTTLDKLTEKHDVYKVIRDRRVCHKKHKSRHSYMSISTTYRKTEQLRNKPRPSAQIKQSSIILSIGITITCAYYILVFAEDPSVKHDGDVGILNKY